MKTYLIAALMACSVQPLCAGLVSPQPSSFADRGRLLLAVGDANGAIDQFRALDDAYPSAVALFDDGAYGRARDAFLRCAADHPASLLAEAALAGAADCLYATGDYAGALREYAAVGKSMLPASQSATLSFREGVCAYYCGHGEQAAQLLEQAAADPSLRSDARFYLGAIAFDSGDYPRAEKLFALVNTATAPGDQVAAYLARIDFAQERWAKALGAARRLLRHPDGSDNPEMLRVAGESLCRLDKKDEGMPFLRKYLTLTKEPVPSAQYIVGVADYEEGDYDAALDKLNMVTENADGAIRQSAYLYIGQTLMNRGDNSAAMLAFDKATQSDADPGVREAAYYNYAVAKLAGGSLPFKSSAETLEEFLRRYPDGPYSARVAASLAEGYLADKDYEAALERLERVPNPPKRMLTLKQRVLYSLAWQSLVNNDLAAAETYVGRAAAIDGDDKALAEEVALLQGRVLADKGLNSKAVDYFRRYLDRTSAQAPNRLVAEYGLAYALYSSGKRAEAEKAFGQLAAKATDNIILADAYSRLGDLRYAADDFAGAAAYYDKAYSANADGGDAALFNHARMLGYMRDYQGKLAALDSFRSRYPNSLMMPEALLETSQAQISLGRNAEAVDTYDTLIERYATTAAGRKAYLQKAMTLIDMARRPEAFEAYRNLISRYPTSDEAAQAAVLLKNLYMEDGKGDEYLAFVRSVENAPKIDPEEAEEINYATAMREYGSGGHPEVLEHFMAEYPASLHNAAILARLLADARKAGDADRTSELAGRILDKYPDHVAAEAAMEAQAQALYEADKLPEALEAWQKLEERASDAERANTARLGVMRAARDMGDYDLAADRADAIIASGAAVAAVREARFTKASALEEAGDIAGAIALWQEMADNTADLFGAKSAFRAADALFASGSTAKARKATEQLVQSGSPHRYWVARGFILLSDIYKAEGKDFEAREYLEALRDNYPGTETDILMMIDSRLNPSDDDKK